ncbi:MAG: T9SS type A sorting domain-containing protein [Bacteroidota bacterium]
MKTSHLFTLILSIFLLHQPAVAQIYFQKTYNSTGLNALTAVKQTTDDGFIMTGFVQNAFGDVDIVLIKTDIWGDTLWTTTYGGSGDDGGRDVVQTSDGGYIVTGFSTSVGDHIYVIKTDVWGAVTWSKSYGGPGSQEGESIMQTADGGYIISGELFNGNTDLYLIRINAVGDTLWTRTGATLAPSTRAYSVQETNDAGFVVTGYTANTSNDVYLIKLNSNGDTLWTRSYGGQFSDAGNCVRQTSDGGYIIAGRSSSFSAGFSDVYLLKTDSTGNEVWSKTYGNIGDDVTYSVTLANDGGYVLSGQTTNISTGDVNAYLLKTDATGNVQWSRTYGGSGDDSFKSVVKTNDGGYAAAGYMSGTSGNVSGYLVKTNALGMVNCNASNLPVAENTVATITGNSFNVTSTGGTVVSTSQSTGSGVISNTLCSGVSIDERTLSSPGISPNPSEGIFKISFDKLLAEAEVNIYNIYGEKVSHQYIYNAKEEILNLRKVNPGIYLISIISGDKQYSGRVVVK